MPNRLIRACSRAALAVVALPERDRGPPGRARVWQSVPSASDARPSFPAQTRARSGDQRACGAVATEGAAAIRWPHPDGAPAHLPALELEDPRHRVLVEAEQPGHAVLSPNDGSCAIMALIGAAQRGSTFGAALVGLSWTVRHGTPSQAQSLAIDTVTPSARRPCWMLWIICPPPHPAGPALFSGAQLQQGRAAGFLQVLELLLVLRAAIQRVGAQGILHVPFHVLHPARDLGWRQVERMAGRGHRRLARDDLDDARCLRCAVHRLMLSSIVILIATFSLVA